MIPASGATGCAGASQGKATKLIKAIASSDTQRSCSKRPRSVRTALSARAGVSAWGGLSGASLGSASCSITYASSPVDKYRRAYWARARASVAARSCSTARWMHCAARTRSPASTWAGAGR